MDAGFLETLIRGVAIGGFAATVLVLLPAARTNRVMWVGAAFMVCAIGHAVDNAPGWRLGNPVRTDLFWLQSGLVVPLFWAFLLGVFDEAREKFWPRLIPTAVVLAGNLTLPWLLGERAWMYWVVFQAVSISLMAHVLWVLFCGISGDLVEARRRLRAPIIVAATIYVLINAMGDLVPGVFQRGVFVWPLAQGLMLAGLSLAGAYAFLQAGPIFWGSRETVAVPREIEPAAPDGVEAALLARLRRLLEEGEVWREEGLTVAGLATRLSMPEYRLRQLINTRLGYRNFADFINSHRIAAAKVILSDPDAASRQVSQIAFDLGFGSLGPFNRAFRAATGSTPTQWRADRLAGI